ncbi:armadillo-type protein [Phaeosphaeriaceae sp. PMI808]|nr:armadillo-type protein [Phaeosphaeriaceae sp. PMI808]
MAQLLTELCRPSQNQDTITAASNIPTLGETVLIILDSITNSQSIHVRLQAITALKAMVLAIHDDDALASFLPKIVSSLTKVLTPSSSNRPGFRVVEQSLDVLSLLICRLLSDVNTENLPSVPPTNISPKSSKAFRSASWLQATTSQVKLALANVFRLRTHDKTEVQLALLRLCLQILQNCRISLSACAGMAIETAISLTERKECQYTVEYELRTLLSTDLRLSNLLCESLIGWVNSLPRVMQSKDDDIRHQALNQISVALRLHPHGQASIDERLAVSLCDGVSTVLKDSKGLQELAVQQGEATDQVMQTLTSASHEFQPLSLRLKGQETMMAEFRQLIYELAKSSSALTVLNELSGTVDKGSQEVRLAKFWVCVNLHKNMAMTDFAFDDLIDMGTRNIRQELLDSLYAHSIAILTQREEDNNVTWHFHALALETVALQSSQYKLEFRAELGDILYSILHHLGHSNAALRHHALTCLNILSKNCDYTDVGELLIANVDYVVNAVGLKLAVGDISPQAPKVLLMMMRLCGPSLLPYLDDLVGSIFEALERYHGYSKLTELMFSVLKGLTEEGVKASQLALNQNRINEVNTRILAMADVVKAVKQLDHYLHIRRAEDARQSDLSFPRKPWTTDTPIQNSSCGNDEPVRTMESDNPPPVPRIFDLLLRISQLTQHYLPTSSPSLRIALISLLRTTIPTLAKHQESFLPLINTLWPVLLPRLQDVEAYVVSNALDVVSLICDYAGDFMRSRIEDAWEIFRRLYRRTKYRSDCHIGNEPLSSTSLRLTGIETEINSLSIDMVPLSNTGRPELYVDSPTRMVWDSFVALMCTIAARVTLSDEHFDEILQTLNPVLEQNGVLRSLNVCNADAVWLCLYKKYKHPSSKVSTFVGQAPVGRRDWHFVPT